MPATLLRLYDKLILSRPWWTLCFTLLAVSFFAWHLPRFQLDASGDSLVLEHDRDLQFHREITTRYQRNDVLVLTYSPRGDLFSPATLADLKALRDELRAVDGVEEVTSILDVPLLISTGVSLWEVGDVEAIKTLEKSAVSRETVLAELRDNPLYRGRLLSEDGATTALLVSLPVDAVYRELLARRHELREKRRAGTLTGPEREELAEVSRQYRERLTELNAEEDRLVAAVRSVMARHGEQADLHLGGVPMIVADMIGFIRGDLLVFGGGVLCFLVVTLAVIFRRPRWVLLPLFCCALSVLTMVGYLGLADWRVTVISSNFISLMLILTMSLAIHLIERYLEIHAANPQLEQRAMVLETVRTIVVPCFYTTLTTVVAFGSLLVSGIRPVIDFGLMMTIGLVVAFLIAFLLFPATVVLLEKEPGGVEEDFSNPFTLRFARITENHRTPIMLVSGMLLVASAIGMARLEVENRFIDYFRKKTEIYQGMSLIDRKLGGTTPLDCIVDFPERQAFADEFGEEDVFAEEEETAPWYADVSEMARLKQIHLYLEALPESGEVLSLATLGELTTIMNEGEELDNFMLALLFKKTPEDIRQLLVSPYVSEDIPQARFTMRIREADQRLERPELLARIRAELSELTGLEPERIRLTNMFVLYNNMLQSLFRSQILTMGMVFLAIMTMFLILFRSLHLACIAIIPNILPAAVVLGAMGWFSIPLDMMTITIASIVIGISVDDTIHYVHRFQKEFSRDRNYLATMYRCHRSIGRALAYTTVTITIGFSILVLSNFIPTIYFGLFTGFAMVVALLGDLLLLPGLILLLKPLGPEGEGGERFA